jgi:hypothetical protein
MALRFFSIGFDSGMLLTGAGLAVIVFAFMLGAILGAWLEARTRWPRELKRARLRLPRRNISMVRLAYSPRRILDINGEPARKQ